MFVGGDFLKLFFGIFICSFAVLDFDLDFFSVFDYGECNSQAFPAEKTRWCTSCLVPAQEGDLRLVTSKTGTNLQDTAISPLQGREPPPLHCGSDGVWESRSVAMPYVQAIAQTHSSIL